MTGFKGHKWLYWLLALAALALGLIGIVVPLLPTTPFLIVALWAAGKCSPKLELWLINHPKLGPVLKGWQQHRAIPLTAKWLASLMMLSSLGFIWYRGTDQIVVMSVAIIIILLMAYIFSKPSQ